MLYPKQVWIEGDLHQQLNDIAYRRSKEEQRRVTLKEVANELIHLGLLSPHLDEALREVMALARLIIADADEALEHCSDKCEFMAECLVKIKAKAEKQLGYPPAQEPDA